jgi:hypothetical protein
MKQRLGVMRTAALTAALAAMQISAHAGFSDDPVPVAKPAQVAEKSPVVSSNQASGISVVAPPTEVSVAAPPVSSPVVPAPVPKIVFEVRASDKSLKNTFLRWAEEHRQQVVWRLSGDIPLDANGPVNAVSLADAMTQVAAAFWDKKEPFVIREFDNVIVALPRWAARP